MKRLGSPELSVPPSTCYLPDGPQVLSSQLTALTLLGASRHHLSEPSQQPEKGATSVSPIL